MTELITENILKRKPTWEVVKLSDVCEIDPSKRELNGIEKSITVSFGMMADLGEHKRSFQPTETKTISEVAKSGYSYFREEDVLLAKMTPCFENGKSGIAENLQNGIGFGSTEFYVLRSKRKILADWTYHIISSEKFLEEGKHSLVGTTGRRRLMKQYVETFQIPLPSLEEQKKITAFFQSIETAMEQVDGQEKNLKSLRKSLINRLKKQEPEFGNLLFASNCKEYSIGDLAIEIPDRTDNPQKSGIERFIGLEDFESGELTIQKFSSTEKLVSAMKLCKQSDVLFARRNAYLKRASLTEFDAVCSGDVIVMRANEEIIFPKFLILIMNSDEFWEFAISNAAGTMSKRVKWRDLATYTFELPNLEIQEKILQTFNQLETTLSQLKKQKVTLKNLKQKLLNEILG
jgi:restriction endonuclease S subunit